MLASPSRVAAPPTASCMSQWRYGSIVYRPPGNGLPTRASSSSTAIATPQVSTKRTIGANGRSPTDPASGLQAIRSRDSLLNQTFDQFHGRTNEARRPESNGSENATVRADRHRASVHAGGGGRGRDEHPPPACPRPPPGRGRP